MRIVSYIFATTFFIYAGNGVASELDSHFYKAVINNNTFVNPNSLSSNDGIGVSFQKGIPSFTVSADKWQSESIKQNGSNKMVIYTNTDKESFYFRQKHAFDLKSNGRLESFAQIRPHSVHYITKNKEVKCYGSSRKGWINANKWGCRIYQTTDCAHINEQYINAFGGDHKKARKCTDALHNIYITSSYPSKNLLPEESSQLLKYVSATKGYMISMRVGKIAISNHRENIDTNALGFYSLGAINFCKSRGLIGKDKAPFVRDSSLKKRVKKTIVQ